MIKHLASVLAALALACAPAAAQVFTQPTAQTLGFSYGAATYCSSQAPCAIGTGSTIDGTIIGGGTPAAGTFTNLAASGIACTAAGCAFTLSPILPLIVRTAGYTIPSPPPYFWMLANAASAGFSYTLPACTASNIGETHAFVRTDTSANTVTIARNGTDTITGISLGLTLPSQQSSALLACDGAGGWWSATPTSVASLRTTALGVAAAGTTIGTATGVKTDVVVVTTVASGAGVSLRAFPAGLKQEVFNRGANALLVYPPASGAAIEASAAGAAVSLAVGAHASFWCVSATQCYQAP